MKRRKKNSIARIIVLGLGKFVVAMAVAFAILVVFTGAYLQESYKLNPPTEAERAEHPVLIEFLIGSDSEINKSIPYRNLSHSPLLRIEGWRKPNELCRVATLLQMRRYR